MPPKIGSSPAPVSDHFPARGNDGTHGSSSPRPLSGRAAAHGNEALRGALAQRTNAGGGPAAGAAAGLRRSNSMSRLADFSRAALERQTTLPTTSRERQNVGSLLVARDTERPAESIVASDATPARPGLKLGGSTPTPTPSARPQLGGHSGPAPHGPAPAPAPAYGYPAHSPHWSAPTYRTHQFGAHRPLGFSYGHGLDAFGTTHAHVGFHFFGRQHTFRYSVSESMSSFWKGFTSGLLKPVVYHAPPSSGYADGGAYHAPYAGHHFYAGGYAGHHPYAMGYPPSYAMGYPAGATR